MRLWKKLLCVVLAATLLTGTLALSASAADGRFRSAANVGSTVVEKNGGVYVMDLENKDQVAFYFDKAHLGAPVTKEIVQDTGDPWESLTVIPVVVEPDCQIFFPNFDYKAEGTDPDEVIGCFWSERYIDQDSGKWETMGGHEWWFAEHTLAHNAYMLSRTIYSTFTAGDVRYWIKAADTSADTVAGFKDVYADSYYADAVVWTKEQGITTGTSLNTFSPASTVTRADAVTFLWRAAGQPTPKTARSPFNDVTNPNAYYYKAILWAAESGIAAGVGGGRFAPTSTLSYAHILTFLSRAVNDRAVGSNWSDAAMAWGKARGLTDGITCAAKDNCPRSDVVYFLWKQLSGAVPSKPQDPEKPGESEKPGTELPASSVALHSSLSWSDRTPDYSVSHPLTGYAKGYYAISNGDGTLSGLVVPPSYDGKFYVERYDAKGNVADSKALSMELPIFGAFFDSGEHFYMAFGQMNQDQKDSQEVYRIVQYDRQWNRLGAVSVNGGTSYTKEPYRSTVSRMAVSDDGSTVTLYAARTRYDGHQSNITITMNTAPFSIQTVQGEKFPSNHVSHSFGQFVRYDGSSMVTVDHGDAYPRSFVLQKGGKELDLLKIAGPTGQNVTHAIGSGLEVSQDGYLFLGCSAPQKDFDAEESTPWQVFLTYTDKGLAQSSLTWLTAGSDDIDTARLVKLSNNAFLVMWGQGSNVHYLTVDGRGSATSGESVLTGAAMPTTQPVVNGSTVLWIGVTKGSAAIYSIQP